MTGRGWRLFKLVSMLLVAAAVSCAFSLAGTDEVKFWSMLAVVCLISLAYIALFIRCEQNLHSFVSEMESQLNLTERDSLYKFPAPALIVDSDGIIIWFNKAFTEQIHASDAYGVHLSQIIDIDLSTTFSKIDTVVEYNAGHYRIRAVTTEKKDESNTPVSELSLLYFQDVSELIDVKNEYARSRNWVAMLLIDSYDELFAKVKDSDKAHITMQIDKLAESFIEEHNGLMKKISSDRYFAIISENELIKLEEEKFKSILDKVHQILVAEHTPVTLSIGIGRGGSNLRESEEMARQALDMTQGRGGDQVAVKDEKDFTFFGGNSSGIEKSTKVKTRIFSSGLISLIRAADKTILMGHAWGDLDAIGAAAGLCGAIRAIGADAYVFSDTDHTLAMPIIDRLRENLEDGSDLIINEETALEMMTENTLLIICDTNNKDLLDSRQIYEKAKNIVFIDHHRQVVNCIDNAVLSLHEPYASSASEMVAEVIQYFGYEQLSSYYADAMLAGIMLDTKDFVMKTGVRTFEAAAYLKKLGADTVAVKRLFAISIETGIKRSQLVETAEIYNRCAIAASEDSSDGIRIATSQAADELLGIQGVDASFVIYAAGTGANISARSFGIMNVQIIMEHLGGGGHQTMAAAQLKDISVSDAKKQLMAAIDEYIRSIS